MTKSHKVSIKSTKKSPPPPKIRRVHAALQIDQKDVFAIDIMLDRSRFPKLDTGAMALVIQNAMRSAASSMPTPPAPPTPDFAVADALEHLENTAKVHELMRARGLAFCSVCGKSLIPS